MTAPEFEVSVPARFAETVSRFAARPAVSGPDRQRTYAELDQDSDAIAALVQSRAGDSSEPVALLMEHGAELVAAIMGVLKAGRIYVAMIPRQPNSELSAQLADSGARLIVTDRANAAAAGAIASSQVEVLQLKLPSSELSSRAKLPPVAAGTAAWLMYTSGSTGHPKGVWQDHRGLVHEADVYAGLLGIKPEDRLCLLAPCGLSASGATLFGALLSGATLCLFDVRAQGTDRLGGWIEKEGITVYHSVPTLFRQLARPEESAAHFATVRWIRVGGEPVFRNDLELFRKRFPKSCRFMQSFSSTETGLISTWVDNPTAIPAAPRIPAGRPVPGVEIVLLDDAGRPVASNGEGRIAVRSARLRQGYWRQPEETDKAFRSDPKNPSQRMFASKDLGRWLPDGNLEHLGRADRMVKVRGLRADLAEIEAALDSTGLFNESAAVARAEENGEVRLVAYVVPRNVSGRSAAECRNAMRTRVPEHMIPNEFFVVGQLARTTGGKVDYNRLPLPSTRSGPAKSDKPRDRLESKLAEIWMGVLGRSTLDRHEDFFDSGGDSLRATRLLSQVEDRFGVALSPAVLAEHPVFADLAAALARQIVTPSGTPLVRLHDAPSGRPLFLVHDGHGDVTAFVHLARRLPERPVYALQSLGLNGQCWPYTNIPAMARRYLEEVTKVDRTGPYLIAGMCVGGLVAFEMAQQLRRQGRPVALIALLGTPAPPYSGRRTGWHELVIDSIRDVFRMLRWRVVRALPSGVNPRRLPKYRNFVGGMNDWARRFYRPQFYPGRLTMVTTTGRGGRDLGDRRLLMGRFARESQVITLVSERAKTLVPPEVDQLVAELRKCLAEAESPASSPARETLAQAAPAR